MMPDNPIHPQQHRRSDSSNEQRGVPSMSTDASTDAPAPVPGFLGPTSYSAVFTEGESNIGLKNQEENREINIRSWPSPELPNWDSKKLAEGVEVLRLLGDLDVYEPAIERWFQISGLYSTILFARDCISLVPAVLKTHATNERDLTNFAHKIFWRTSTPVPLDPNISLKAYPSFLMGENLSWEVVGIVLSVLGTSAIMIDEVDVMGPDLKIDWKDRVRKLVVAGDRCIHFCDQFGHLKGKLLCEL